MTATRTLLLSTVFLPIIAHATADDVVARRELLEQHAMANRGSIRLGKQIYETNEKLKCSVCHRLNGKGGEVGPDLSSVGNKLGRAHLVESLLQPSKQIGHGYHSTVFVTDDGLTITGIVKSRTDAEAQIVDAAGKPLTVQLESVVDEVTSDVSLMPDGMIDALTAAEFTNLVAYLETLAAGPKFGPGAGSRGPMGLPEGFEVDVVASQIDGATAMAVTPDGRLFVCEQAGAIRVIENDRLIAEPLLTFDVELNWERGLIGIAVDPAFPTEPWVYVNRVVDKPFSHHVISRFRVDGNRGDISSEEVLLTGDDQSKLGGKVKAGHQGGAIHFGADGCLYIAIGEQTAKTPAQKFDTLLGKILRIHRDGSIPSDNPFADQTTGKYGAIWAIGCRNPFTFAVRKSDGRMLINDVGGAYEEVNVGKPGANFGWPNVDHGPALGTANDGVSYAIHTYRQASIAGGDFAPASWPEPWSERYLFADFNHGWIHGIDADKGGEAETFAAGLQRPVDMRFSKQGDLYVLLRNAWIADDKLQRKTGSILKIGPVKSQ